MKLRFFINLNIIVRLLVVVILINLGINNLNAKTNNSRESYIKVLPVPFTVQAPFGLWDHTHQESCEEASMIMLSEYVKKNKTLRLSAEYAEGEIQKLVDWQIKSRGFFEDTTAQETVSILKDYFSIEAKVVSYDVGLLKKEILAGRPVLVPAAGRLLKNPYFRRPGPLYHMLVVKGFAGSEFIVNDPGTKRGENYRYTEKVLTRAAHDLNSGKVDKGEKVMVVLAVNPK